MVPHLSRQAIQKGYVPIAEAVASALTGSGPDPDSDSDTGTDPGTGPGRLPAAEAQGAETTLWLIDRDAAAGLPPGLGDEPVP